MINSQVKAFFYIVRVAGQKHDCRFHPSNDQVVNAVGPLHNLMRNGYFTHQKMIDDTWALLGDQTRREQHFKVARGDVEELLGIISEVIEGEST